MLSFRDCVAVRVWTFVLVSPGRGGGGGAKKNKKNKKKNSAGGGGGGAQKKKKIYIYIYIFFFFGPPPPPPPKGGGGPAPLKFHWGATNQIFKILKVFEDLKGASPLEALSGLNIKDFKDCKRGLPL